MDLHTIKGRALKLDMNRPQASPPDEQLLDKLIEHVAYEVAAMEESAGQFARRSLWLYLDGFLLHARALREFFLGRWHKYDRHAESSVFAEHYLTQWRSIKGSLPTRTLGATEESVDKQLAHITRERVTAYTQLEASVPSIKEELMELWGRFIAELRGDRRQRFLEALEAKRQGLKV